MSRKNDFFDFVKSRSENAVEEWVRSLSCPIIRVDGVRPIEENINLIMRTDKKIASNLLEKLSEPRRK